MRKFSIVAAACLYATVAGAEDNIDESAPYVHLNAGFGYHSSSGDYGDHKATEIAYIPLIIRGDIESWTLELTLPYIYIRGPQGIFGVVDGTQSQTNNDVDHHSGLGDILLSGAYTLWPWWERMPFLTGSARVKFPTASENDGLGTGQFDFYFSGQAVWAAGAFTPFIELGYEHLGDSSQVNLRDAARLSSGLSYKLIEPLDAGISFDYGSPTSADAGQRIDLVPFVYWTWMPSWSLTVYASAGLADGSPDGGVGVELGYDLYESSR